MKKLLVVVEDTPLILALKRQRQFEFEASLVCIVCSGTGGAVQGDPILKNKQTNKQTRSGPDPGVFFRESG